MADLGYISLVLALVVSLYATIASFVGGWRRFPEFVSSARNAVYVTCGLSVLASIALLYSFLSHDFSLEYVATYSSQGMSFVYTAAAFWAGGSGSLLFWVLVLSISASIVVIHNRHRHQALMPYVIAVMTGTLAFFLLLMVFVAESNPFTKLPFVPADGNGLNPLLENAGMTLHPPTTLWGYAGFTIPFAFAIAALITRKLGNEWVASIRRWTLVAWIMLTLGNLVGAWWAYEELGWGGYWAWDPVENASFLPWLTATAFLHSIMIQRRRGMLKVWNIVLILITFSLSIFGTFLVRSGVLNSVHSFGQSGIGIFFLLFIGATLLGTLLLLFTRLDDLRGEDELDSFASRESSFLMNNLILVGIAFAVFFGSIFPLLSEWVKGNKITVGPPFFDQVTTPMFLLLVLLMGICPLIGWRKASVNNLVRNFLYPLGAGLVAGILLGIFAGASWLAVLGFSSCAFVVTSILLEWYRGTRARHRTSGENHFKAFFTLLLSNRPRYGGYIVHLGVILIVVGVIGSHAFRIEKEASLRPGEQVSISSPMSGKTYTLQYEGLSQFPTATKQVVSTTFSVYNSNSYKGTITPEIYYHNKHSDQPVSEVAIRSTNIAGFLPMEDLYVILVLPGENSLAAFKFVVNPLVSWIWIGGLVLVLGTIIAFWPERTARKKEAE